jgi:hypothetical protein
MHDRNDGAHEEAGRGSGADVPGPGVVFRPGVGGRPGEVRCPFCQRNLSLEGSVSGSYEWPPARISTETGLPVLDGLEPLVKIVCRGCWMRIQ